MFSRLAARTLAGGDISRNTFLEISLIIQVKAEPAFLPSFFTMISEK
jgi:hypothetical protein